MTKTCCYLTDDYYKRTATCNNPVIYGNQK